MYMYGVLTSLYTCREVLYTLTVVKYHSFPGANKMHTTFTTNILKGFH